MCWLSETNIPLESDGTVKFIKVCGVENGQLRAYWHDSFKYELNQQPSVINVPILFDPQHQRYFGKQGFHCYDANTCKIRVSRHLDICSMEVLCDNIPDCIGNYLMESSVHGCVACLVEGYLPKGAIYHVNKRGEIISNAIVLTKIIDLNAVQKNGVFSPIN